MYIQELRKLVGNFPLILVRPTLILYNSLGEILLVKHNDNSWGLPGGLLEPGESIEESIRRELLEELDINIEEMIYYKIFSGQSFYQKTSSGRETQYIAITYSSNQYCETIKPDQNEIIEYKFCRPNELPEKTMEMIQIIIQDFANSQYYRALLR